jgi:O-antigen/teichoic acid export membrane protein
MPSLVLTSRSVALLVALLQVGKAIALTKSLPRKSTDQPRIYFQNKVEYQALVREGLPFYWLAIMTAAVSSIPVLFLGLRSSSAEVGFFNAPSRILSPLQLLLTSGIAVLYPLLSTQSVSDPTAFVQTVKKAMVIIIIIGSCLGLCISLVRAEVVLMLFGPGFEQCADILMYQCWLTLFLAIYSLIGTVLSARDRQRTLAMVSTVYAVATIPFVWIGSAHGAVGLAIGMLLGTIINFVYHWIVFQRIMPIGFAARESLLLLGLVGLFAVPAWWLPSTTNWIIRLSVIILGIALSCVGLVQARRWFIFVKSTPNVRWNQV